jgi:hypothetical protein
MRSRSILSEATNKLNSVDTPNEGRVDMAMLRVLAKEEGYAQPRDG